MGAWLERLVEVSKHSGFMLAWEKEFCYDVTHRIEQDGEETLTPGEKQKIMEISQRILAG